MKVIVSQKEKKIEIVFKDNKIVDKYTIDKAEEFLVCLDRFIKKSRIEIKFLKNARLEFCNLGLLTERVIRAIMLGLDFHI